MDNTYWAAKPTTEFVKEMFSRLRTDDTLQPSTRSAVRRNIELAYLQYYGAACNYGASSAEITRGGEEGELAAVRVNWLRSHINAKLQIITQPALSWTVNAVNSDAKSMSASVLGSQVLEYYWQQRTVGAQAIQAVSGSIVYGEEALFTPWSADAGEDVLAVNGQTVKSGDVLFINVPSWDLLRDSSAKSYDQLPWIGVRLWENKYDLAARFPGKADRILSVGTSTELGSVVSKDVPTASDLIPVYYTFHKKSPALKKGREAILLSGDVWLKDGPLTYKTIPVHRMASGELEGTPWAYSDTWEALGIQELSDSIQTSLATNITTFGCQLISAESGTDLNVDTLAGGPRVVYRTPGSQPPTPLQLTASPKEAFTHLERLKGDQRQVLGLNDAAMGEQQGAQPNAQNAALQASMAIQANSGLQKKYLSFVQAIGKSVLETFQQRATTERKIAINGKRSPGFGGQTSFKAQDIEGLSDVFVTMGSAMSQNQAGRMQLAQMHIQAGYVQTPEQLEAVVETGRLEPLVQDLRNELLLIAEENEDLQKGINPPVSTYDSHQLHVRQHKGVMASAQARKNPEIIKATQAHIKMHLDELFNADPRVLAVLGQAPVPPAPPPAAAAAPPGPGTPPPEGPPTAENPEVELPANPLSGEPFNPTDGGLPAAK